MEILVVTGMSGAGKSNLLNFLEDRAYYCIDNMPPVLLPKFLEIIKTSGNDSEKLAFVMDIRGGMFFNDLFDVLDGLKEQEGIYYKVIFLEASNNELIKRFKERRRPHPLSLEGSIKEGIEKERELLKDLKKRSDYIIDTSNLKLSVLKFELEKIINKSVTERKMTILIESFGFKYGILNDADLVFDVRFIPNPFYIEELRPKSGMDAEIKEYLDSFKESTEFFGKLTDMLEYLIPLYIREGKTQIVIGIGCTGGRHRSVYMAERLYEYFKDRKKLVVIRHRDKEIEGNRCE